MDKNSPTTTTLSAGTKLGHYEIHQKLGAGGMGEVYLAEDLSELRRRVAIKVLSKEVASDRERMQRFVQEAQTTSSLNHPNILTIFEIGDADNTRFIVTELIEGESLRERLARTQMDCDEALEIAIQVAAALVAAHKAKIAHRDIKPENIMIRRDDGIVKVLDFGLAKPSEPPSVAGGPAGSEDATRVRINTDPGTVMGTVGYMSPEQARGALVDERTDIWSLGCVLYEMIAGCLPFPGATANDVISRVLSKEQAPPLARFAHNVPERLEEIATKALTKDREERYQTAKDLLIDLKHLRQKRELEHELERSVSPDRLTSAPTITTAANKPGTVEQVAETTNTNLVQTTSSAEYIVRQIKSHRRGAFIMLATFIIAASVLTYVLFFKSDRAAALTDRDTILLTEFDNKTGEEVFDDTLRQGLAVQLRQSPFLDIFPDARVQATLRLMNRSPDEPVTRETGREICQRQGLKALIAGSIAKFDRNYSITLEALNGQTGDSLALVQVEAEGKDKVLKALSGVAADLREKLGESLSSIQKFDAPLEVTTSSLEALKDFALANVEAGRGQFVKGVELYRRAIERDANFASAWAALAVQYANTNQPELAAECAAKGFALRDRVSEYERARITLFYYSFVTGELDKAIEAQESHKRNYPRDHTGPGNLSHLYGSTGQWGKAVAAAREALLLSPNISAWYANLAESLLRLNRFAESGEVCQRAIEQEFEPAEFPGFLYSIAFVNGDAQAMQEQIARASGRSDEYSGVDWQTQTAAFAGEWRKSQELSRRATEMAVRGKANEYAAQFAVQAALRAAAVDQVAEARVQADAALKVDRNKVALTRAALALALAGDAAKAESLVRELEKQYPKDTAVNQLWLPATKAALEIRKSNAQSALDLLEPTKRYESAVEFWPQTVRGLAYLKLGKGAEAAAEYRKILDHRGEAPLSLLWPLAHLGLGRAAASQGDTARARQSYDEFFKLWKDADADLPILIEAKKEYEKLK